MKVCSFLSIYCSFSVSTGPNVLDFYRGFIRFTFQIKLPALHDKLNLQSLYLERRGQQISKNTYHLRIFKIRESLCQEIGIIAKVSLQLYHRILMFGLHLWDLLLSTLLFDKGCYYILISFRLSSFLAFQTYKHFGVWSFLFICYHPGKALWLFWLYQVPYSSLLAFFFLSPHMNV